jgi:hypothetical protein
MRYYEYISDSKVDMLFPQVPRSILEIVSVELGINIGIFDAKVTIGGKTDSNRVARLMAVEKYLISSEKIGTVSAPTSWFRGSEPATSFSLPLPPDQTVVFFLINSPSYTVALGGSPQHIIGNVVPKSDFEYSKSHLPSLLGSLNSLMEKCVNLPDDGLPYSAHSGVTDFGSPHPWTQIICDLSDRQNMPKQDVSFLARKIVSEEYCGKTITLGTPLYVTSGD